MATKFAQQFQQSNKELYATRGQAVAQQMSNASEQIRLELKNRKFELEMGINEMMDFGKNNTTALDIKKPESYKEFIHKLAEKKKELELLEIEIDIYNELHTEWFEEAEEAPKKASRSRTKASE